MTAKLAAIIATLVLTLTGFAAYMLNLQPAHTFGAIPGNSVQGTQWTVGNVTEDYISANWTATSSSVCVLYSPPATSTPESLSFVMTALGNNGWSGTLPVAYMGTSTSASKATASSTNPYFISAAVLATSTPFFWQSPGSATTSSNLWGGNVNSNNNPVYPILPPNTPIVVQLATSTPGTFPTYNRGTCDGIFRRVSGSATS
jgi:hypothetical protein